MKNAEKSIDHITVWVMVGSFFLLPLFFLPFTADFYDFNKWVLLLGSALVILLLWALRTVLTGSIVLTLSSNIVGFALLTVSSLATLLIVSTNKIDGLTNSLGLATFSALTLLSLFGSHVYTPATRKYLRWGLFASVNIIGLLALYQFVGLGETIAPTSFLSSTRWTPTGSNLTAIVIFCMTLPLLIGELLESIQDKNETKITIFSLSTLLVTGSLGITIYQILPSFLSSYLPINSGWAIVLESMKNIRNAFLGVGPENFLNAFASGRPVQLNLSPVWNIRFLSNSTLVLHILTTLGLAGFFALLVVAKSLLSLTSTLLKTDKKSLPLLRYASYLKALSLLFVLLSLFLGPPGITVFIVIFVIVLSVEKDAHIYRFHLPSELSWISYTVMTSALILVVGGFYLLGRLYIGEMTFFESLKSYQVNDGKTTYEKQIKALQILPSSTRMHIAFSQTNFALASSIARSAIETQKGKPAGTISDQDRNTITALIQQAIRESRIALNLAPQSILVWENIASLYESLIGISEGSETFAIAGYSQAIALDPTNINLRMRLGGLYIWTNAYDLALQQFTIMVNLKPDFANAYYNLANIYKLKGDTAMAIAALEKTKSLIPAGSDEVKKVDNETALLKKTTGEKQAPAPAQAPPQAPEQSGLSKPGSPPLKIKPPIALPNEDGTPPQPPQATESATGE